MTSAALAHIFGAVAGELLRNKLEEHSVLLLGDNHLIYKRFVLVFRNEFCFLFWFQNRVCSQNDLFYFVTSLVQVQIRISDLRRDSSSGLVSRSGSVICNWSLVQVCGSADLISIIGHWFGSAVQVTGLVQQFRLLSQQFRVSPRKTRSTRRGKAVFEESPEESIHELEEGGSEESQQGPTDSQDSSDNAEKRAKRKEMMRTAVAAHQEEPAQKRARHDQEKEAYEQSQESVGATSALWNPQDVQSRTKNPKKRLHRVCQTNPTDVGSCGGSFRKKEAQEEEAKRVKAALEAAFGPSSSSRSQSITIIELPKEKKKTKAPEEKKKSSEVVGQNIFSTQPNIPFILEQLEVPMPSPSTSSSNKSYDIIELESGDLELHEVQKSQQVPSPTTELPSMEVDKEKGELGELVKSPVKDVATTQETEIEKSPPRDTLKGKEIEKEQPTPAAATTEVATQKPKEWTFGEELFDDVDEYAQQMMALIEKMRLPAMERASMARDLD
ncbi:hypothetical protein L7F22_065543 [Adiantum nelumboides]|nr:hypothetical protein [Adiantum nelumboides]